MEKININLLPLEVAQVQKAQSKFQRVQSLSVATILGMIFLASLTFSLGILQNKSIKEAKASLQVAEDKVSQFKNVEGSLLVLKNRIDLVSDLSSTPSKQRLIFNLVSNLLPPSASINALAVDRSGTLTMTIVASNGVTLDEFITNLITPEKNEGNITKVEMDSFSRGRDGTYRASLKITPH